MSQRDPGTRIREAVPGVGALGAGALVAGALLALGSIGAGPLSAQGPEPPWSSGLFYDGDYFAGSSPVWTDWWTIRAVGTRSVGPWTLGLETTVTERFDQSDESVAAEAYVELWSGSYAHVRGRASSEGLVFPLSDWRAELFQSLGGGWEASGSVWLMNHPGPDVELGGLGLAYYVGRWYLRSRGSLAEIGGRQAASGAVFVRRFLEDTRQWVEIGGGLGEEVVILGVGPLLEVRETWFVSGSFQRYLFGPLGLHVSASLNDFEGIPRRRHLSTGIIARF